MNNKFKINLNSLLPKDIQDINNFMEKNKNSDLLIRLDNTCGIKSSDLLKISDSPNITFRIAGAYDEDRKKRTNNYEYYENKNFYTRNELIGIIRTFELIESEIKEDYSPFKIALFIHEKLKRYIVYDHDYHFEHKKDLDSLLGILYRKTSSYGFSLIYKEMLDRQGIKCYLVEGNNMRYAWNILEINDNLYCIDLSYDSYLYHFACSSVNKYFGNYDNNLFKKFHRPIDTEIITDYDKDIKQISDTNLCNFNYQSEIKAKALKTVRSDKTSFVISGVEVINDSIPIYKYLYCDYRANGQMDNPKILLSEMNIFELNKKKDEVSKQIKYLEGINNEDNTYKKQDDELKQQYALLKKYNDYIINNFLSIKRIESNNYIGSFTYEDGNFKEIINSDNVKKYSIVTRKYRRDDGSVFILEKVKNENNLYYYNCYELFQTEVDYLEFEINHFMIDNDVFNIPKQMDKYVANVFFHHNRILQCVNEKGGYLGYCPYGDLQN